MLKVELHSHTSDDPVDRIPYSAFQLIDRAATLGYDALAITLHERRLDPRHLASYAADRGLVLIPGIERCQTCHGGARASSPMVPSECVLCHPFHRREYDRMRPIEVAPAARNQDETILTGEAG